MSNEKIAWKDVVIVAKFALSCLGLVATGCTFLYNLNMRNYFIDEHSDDNKYKGKEKVC